MHACARTHRDGTYQGYINRCTQVIAISFENIMGCCTDPELQNIVLLVIIFVDLG